MFRKILIANRGEIARRIVRTAKRMGIASVAVYSDADRFTPGVMEADEAIRIGPAPATQSYLDVEAVVAACRATGAEAVHPGYGFLSENVAFAERLAAEGIAPSASSTPPARSRRPAACRSCPAPTCCPISMRPSQPPRPSVIP